ncbi:hypothetical protein HW555_013548 [Spodoptera exigua]|uniref:Uncharacterized protein n=1 Tax=Spodoptera exigua TaxID=7107 RepID=A0A835G364_SPOEX|nr:hypothetical protein HW555_013548 [Spodoptera exigua]
MLLTYNIPLWNCEAPSIFGQSQTISLQYLGDGSERITRRVTSIYGDPQIAQTPLGGNIYEMTLTSRPGFKNFTTNDDETEGRGNPFKEYFKTFNVFLSAQFDTHRLHRKPESNNACITN